MNEEIQKKYNNTHNKKAQKRETRSKVMTNNAQTSRRKIEYM